MTEEWELFSVSLLFQRGDEKKVRAKSSNDLSMVQKYTPKRTRMNCVCSEWDEVELWYVEEESERDVDLYRCSDSRQVLKPETRFYYFFFFQTAFIKWRECPFVVTVKMPVTNGMWAFLHVTWIRCIRVVFIQFIYEYEPREHKIWKLHDGIIRKKNNFHSRTKNKNETTKWKENVILTC